jgi:hypothetical protein
VDFKLKTMKKSKIKLYYLEKMSNGTIRLQSQLLVGRNDADFIMEDGKVKIWRHDNNNGFGFYDYNEPYEIVHDINEMRTQAL